MAEAFNASRMHLFELVTGLALLQR